MTNQERIILFNLARLENSINSSFITLMDRKGNHHPVSLATGELFVLVKHGSDTPTNKELDDMLVRHVKEIWGTINKVVGNG